MDISVVGISSGSAGSETTYSEGEYFSENNVNTITITESQGQILTETVTTPFIVQTFNATIVESAGGAWFTASASIGSNIIADGSYESCSFDSNGGTSVSCTELDFQPFTTVSGSGAQATTVTEVETFSQTWGGYKTALTVLTEVALPSRTGSGSTSTQTGSSNAAGRMSNPYWGVGVFTSFFMALVLME